MMSTYDIGRSRHFLDHDAAVGACLALLVVDEPRAEALFMLADLEGRSRHSAHSIAVRVTARYCVRLIEHAVTDFAGEVGAEAVKV